MTAVKNMLQKRNLRKSIAYAGISPIMILKSIDPRKVRHEGAFIFFLTGTILIKCVCPLTFD